MRLALTLLVGLAFALVSGEEAQAASNTDSFRSSALNLCIKERSQIYQWSQNGHLYGQSVTRPFRYDCSTALSPAPPGYLWGQAYVEKWDPYYRDYYYCTDAEWYNSSFTSKHVVYVDVGPRYYRTCGPGYYRTWAKGSAWVRGDWRTTDWVNSGYAYFY